MEEQIEKNILLKKCKSIITDLKSETENLQNCLKKEKAEKNLIKKTLSNSNITSILKIEKNDNIVSTLKKMVFQIKKLKNEKRKFSKLKLDQKKIENEKIISLAEICEKKKNLKKNKKKKIIIRRIKSVKIIRPKKNHIKKNEILLIFKKSSNNIEKIFNNFEKKFS